MADPNQAEGIEECRTYLDGLLSKASSEQRMYGLSFVVDRALEDADRFLQSCPDLGTEIEESYHKEIADIRLHAKLLEEDRERANW